MKKPLISILILVCLICSVMCACGAKEEITADQAIAIMLEDLGNNAKIVSDPHVHTGTYQNKECYSIYVNINEEPWIYVISAEGDILLKAPSGGHSH